MAQQRLGRSGKPGPQQAHSSAAVGIIAGFAFACCASGRRDRKAWWQCRQACWSKVDDSLLVAECNDVSAWPPDLLQSVRAAVPDRRQVRWVPIRPGGVLCPASLRGPAR